MADWSMILLSAINCLIALATGALGLTDEQLDALFLAASSL